MSEQRDQWGETPEERHARILARDLAWMTYAEACARDGVPRTEKDHGIFNAGYAAGRADYLPGAGVVAEEPECKHSDFFSLNLGSGQVRHTCRDCGETTDFDN